MSEDGSGRATGGRTSVVVRRDDLTGAPTRAVIARHLRGMHENSPPESVHAFDIDKLRAPGVTFWLAWVDGEIAGCGALKRIDARRGELKSIRVAVAYRGRRVGRRTLEHFMAEARRVGLESLWLETGSAEACIPAIKPTRVLASCAAGHSPTTRTIRSRSS